MDGAKPTQAPPTHNKQRWMQHIYEVRFYAKSVGQKVELGVLAPLPPVETMETNVTHESMDQ